MGLNWSKQKNVVDMDKTAFELGYLMAVLKHNGDNPTQQQLDAEWKKFQGLGAQRHGVLFVPKE